MSAEQYSDDFGGQFAQPTVDILPMPGGKRAKGSSEPATEVAQAAEPVGWEPIAPTPAVPAPAVPALTVPVLAAPPPPNDVPVFDAPTYDPPVFDAPAFGPPPAVAPAVVAPAVVAPVFDASTFPGPVPAADVTPAEVVSDDDAPKKFFGMQVRRPRKKAAEDEAPQLDGAAAELNPYATTAFDPNLAAFPPPAPPAGYEAVVAPVAAWPTDSSVSVVADAEPSLPSGAYAAPSPYAPVDLFAHAVDGPPVEAVDVAEATGPTGPPVEAAADAPASAPDEAPPLTPGNPWMPVPVAVVAAPAVAEPAPAVAEPAQDESRALRALLEASEAGRAEAEARAAQATAQAQQQLAQLEHDAQTRIAAAEAKTRKTANDAQDWQIRHREAETTIAELAASVASAEQRMAEIRAERDDLLAELEAATAPTPSHSPAPQV